MKKLLLFATGVVFGGIAVALTQDRRLREGDLIQWESGGKYMFSEPKPIERIESSEFGTFYFVEDSVTGIPMHQVIPMSNIFTSTKNRIAHTLRRFPIDV